MERRSERVGVIGFSAGGGLAGLSGIRFLDPVKNPVDDIDKLDAKPTLQALIYGTPAAQEYATDFPGRRGLDPIYANYPDVYKMLKDVGDSAELHIYAGVRHGFAIQGSSPSAVSSWPDRLRDWMFDLGFLTNNINSHPLQRLAVVTRQI